MSWQNLPYMVELKKGAVKAFCMCGRSQNPPYCDGSHQGTDCEPHVYFAEKDVWLWICGCGRSAKRPFCDARHKYCQREEGE